MSCPATVHDNVCVEAEVTITPKVTVDEIKTYCKGGPIIGSCPGTPAPFCSFTVSQNICVEIPLTFYAEATVTPNGIVCNGPGIGDCPVSFTCTLTIGYFKNHPEDVNDLIADAGGSIVLGADSSGLSFTVTEDNANDVLSFKTPLPGTIETQYAAQYQVLYAQLLAANLNVINGAMCSAADAAIAAANMFLATSPPEGTAGAADVQQPLADFNEGALSGCPGHCQG